MNLAVHKLVTPCNITPTQPQGVTTSPGNLYGSSLSLFRCRGVFACLGGPYFERRAIVPNRHWLLEGRRNRDVKRGVVANILGSLANFSDDWCHWAPRGRRPVAYISPFTPSSARFSPPGRISPSGLPVPSCLHMDAIKGSLGPLHLNTSSILDTLVGMLRFSPGKWSELFPSETSCHWRYGRDSAEGLSICMEWICRLLVSSLEVIPPSKGQLLAFYLTAHFSREDHPYDWRVRFITFMCAYSCLGLGRLMHWLSKVCFARRQYRRGHLPPSPCD